MMLKFLANVMDRVASYLGYIKVSEVHAILAAQEAIVATLRDRINTLEFNMSVRGHLEKSIELLHVLHDTHKIQGSDTQKAVDKLDKVTESLLEMMKDVWPAAYDLETEKFNIGMETENAVAETKDRVESGHCDGQLVGHRRPTG